MNEINIRHSREAVQRLAEIADGNGGQVVLVTGGGPPYYAGLRRGGAETLIEAVLTLLNARQYDEVVLATGEGEHLPDFQVAGRDFCSRQKMLWRLKGKDAAPAQTAPSQAGDGLLEDDKLSDLSNKRGRYQVVVPSHLRPWPEQMTDLISHVAKGLQPGGPRRLIVIDDQFLQPRPQHDQANQADRPSGGKANEIARNFKGLPAQCRNSATDIAVICRSAGHSEALLRDKEEGLIGYEFLRSAADSEYARQQALLEIKRFPKLVWPGVPCIELEPMEAGQWNQGWLPNADPNLPLYDILRISPPVPKDDPLAALDKFVGMDAVRNKLNELRDLLRSQEEQERRGRKQEPISLHVALYGQPGTGKTEVARAIAHIYRQLGLLSGPFVHCPDRSDLVAEYVGHTAPKTRAKCEEAKGGVLFIDEAYMLAEGGENDFGREAIGVLLDFMTSKEKRLAVIAAGYPEPMRKFLRANEGLRRRFGHHVNMPEYSDDQLVDILILQARRRGNSVEEAARAVIRDKIAAHRQSCAAANLSFGFAGDAVTLLEKAQLAQARRFRGRSLSTMSDDEIGCLTVEDFEAAQLDLPT